VAVGLRQNALQIRDKASSSLAMRRALVLGCSRSEATTEAGCMLHCGSLALPSAAGLPLLLLLVSEAARLARSGLTSAGRLAHMSAAEPLLSVCL
jgi:hypothetical protein